ncbi:sulfide:quinone reductase [Neosynechococcus sphagnicola sy1]|uniref:Sulfide-quinone reductase n=1 Tax=Neosynechococcus sphagnicola sy1 TaxID=1497020 RepID=A0A098TP69_9CYAN|nr:FAD/NAD(P)-binding oxidoreductase [Neosynechococcus sphagnicola]KGF72618.1 sulfide:quinone reductase [Neosynechococcus sphagnicola sy1]
MAHIIVIGAGLGGLPTAYELRHVLPREHRITLISNQPKFTFVPSLPWVGLGLKSLDQIQLDLATIVPRHGIELILDAVTAIDPKAKQIQLQGQILDYDYAVIATGPELALDAIPGLGPEGGYTQSVCNPHHAVLAGVAWEKFLADPGPIVVGAAPGASCFGPAYEVAFLMHHVLQQKGLRSHVPITFITSEPYAGHLGIGGMANSRWLMRKFMAAREIELMENTAISHFEAGAVHLADGRRIPSKYTMVLPPFRGPRFLREVPGLTDAKGFVPILPTYRHPNFESIYAVGVITQLKAVEPTPIPTGAPKVGLMTEEMALAVAHNISLELGVISGLQLRPTLQAVCFADFGDTGALFLADPLLPDEAGHRHRALTYNGIWVGWMKSGFEKYFLTKMRLGWTIPWFERWGFRAIGLPLVEPIAPSPELIQVNG